MIKKTVEEAINKQITREMYSANLYLSMASYYHSINLNGFANWMRVQFKEEMDHAMKFFDYIVSRGGVPQIGTIDQAPVKWDSPLATFEMAYEHEQKVTNWINELADIALSEHDHATSIFLQWFITEQIEEEANTSEITEKLKLMGDAKGGLFMLDSELKQRQYVPLNTLNSTAN
jgi:ferritin